MWRVKSICERGSRRAQRARSRDARAFMQAKASDAMSNELSCEKSNNGSSSESVGRAAASAAQFTRASQRTCSQDDLTDFLCSPCSVGGSSAGPPREAAAGAHRVAQCLLEDRARHQRQIGVRIAATGAGRCQGDRATRAHACTCPCTSVASTSWREKSATTGASTCFCRSRNCATLASAFLACATQPEAHEAVGWQTRAGCQAQERAHARRCRA